MPQNNKARTRNADPRDQSCRPCESTKLVQQLAHTTYTQILGIKAVQQTSTPVLFRRPTTYTQKSVYSYSGCRAPPLHAFTQLSVLLQTLKELCHGLSTPVRDGVCLQKYTHTSATTCKAYKRESPTYLGTVSPLPAGPLLAGVAPARLLRATWRSFSASLVCRAPCLLCLPALVACGTKVQQLVAGMQKQEKHAHTFCVFLELALLGRRERHNYHVLLLPSCPCSLKQRSIAYFAHVVHREAHVTCTHTSVSKKGECDRPQRCDLPLDAFMFHSLRHSSS